MAGQPTHRFSLAELLAVTEGTLHGTPAPEPAGGFRLCAPEDLAPDSVAVAWSRQGLEEALELDGLLVLSSELFDPAGSRPVIEVTDASLAFARLTAAAADRSRPEPGVHPTAVIAADASVHESASIGAHVTIHGGASVGPGSSIGAGSTLGARSTVGQHCRIHAGVHIYHDVHVGDRVILHSGVVLGADGFGFWNGAGGNCKIEHLGTVTIHDDVEIGANSAVDRGTLGSTSIGPRSKVDNLVQVGHNVTIGSDCLIVAQSAIGGSTVLGDRVTLAGNAAISDHVVIEDDAIIGAMSGVNKRVPKGEFWFGIPAMPHRSFARRQYLLGRLEEIWKFIREARRT